jgi:hypothetical protein
VGGRRSTKLKNAANLKCVRTYDAAAVRGIVNFSLPGVQSLEHPRFVYPSRIEHKFLANLIDRQEGKFKKGPFLSKFLKHIFNR